MKGKDRFTAAEAAEIRACLARVRKAERDEQKRLRGRLRSIGFRISDWDTSAAGFTRSDFDKLIKCGSIAVGDEGSRRPGASAVDETRAAPKPDSPRQPRAGSSRRETAASVQPGLIASATDALSGPRHRLVTAPAHVKDAPGLYAIYGDAETWAELGLGEPADDRPLYIGKAEDSLIKRDLETHFGNGQTGRSTVRRSVAALLRDTRGLRGIPRNPTKPERPANFGLAAEDEEKLGEWMHRHLLLATWAKPTECETLLAVEVRLIAHWRPPLNLKDNASPWKARVSAARRAMADDARDWAAERGYKI